MVVVMILISQDTGVRPSDTMSVFIIMDSAEQTFPAAAYFMAMFIIVVRIAEQSFPAVSNLMAMLIIMIGIAR